MTRQAGEALASETNIRERGGRIVSVGIAPWGIVERRQDLIGRNKDVPYHPINAPKSRFVISPLFQLASIGGHDLILLKKKTLFEARENLDTFGLLISYI